MPAFLERLAKALLEHHPEGLRDVAVVLPGRRAGVVLRKYLAQAAGRTQWSPDLLDMSAFLERISGMRRGNSMEMLFLLYHIHRDIKGDTADGFDAFLQWAPVTLRDMGEVDMHLLDLGDLYRELHAYDEIEEWSFRLGAESSPGKERFSQHWRETRELHLALKGRMHALGMGTAGAVARAAVDSMSDDSAHVPWKAVWFAGLNALEPAPTAVIKALQQRGMAHLAWDADRWYLDDEVQEAGRFLRRSIKALGPGVLPPVDRIRQAPRQLHITALPNPVAQAAHAAEHIMGMPAEERARTAVVLADEALLMPLLECLPADVGPINITMGVSLEAVPIHGLTEAFLSLHAGHRHGSGFLLTDVEALIAHPFVYRDGRTPEMIATLRQSQRHLWPLADLVEALRAAGLPHLDDLVPALEPMQDPVAEAPARFQALLIWAGHFGASDALAREQLYRMALLQQRLDEHLRRDPPPGIGLEAYRILRQRLLREERLDLIGEPLSGLQVMGLLETRAIDHGQVLVLGATEGVLPRGEGDQSWIPNDIRRWHGMPLRHDREAITAYHVMRLLQGTHTLHLLHPAEGAGDGAGPSRYLAQWAHELPGNSATEVLASSRSAGTHVRPTSRIRVAKEGAVLDRLEEVLHRGLSPSALATWLRCPLDFHFLYLMRIRPPHEVDGRLGADVLGQAVHAVLEDIYRPALCRPMAPEELIEAAGLMHSKLLAHMASDHPPELLARGHFRLRIGMAAEAMARYLRAEAEALATRHTVPLELELRVQGTLPDGVRLHGFCDRVEERDGVLHILDLKTGSVKEDALKPRDLARENWSARHRQALQLLIYAWAYLQTHPEVPLVRAAIVPLQRSSSAEGMFLRVGGTPDIRREDLPAITMLLEALVGELRDPAIPFEHDPESEWCQCCVG